MRWMPQGPPLGPRCSLGNGSRAVIRPLAARPVDKAGGPGVEGCVRGLEPPPAAALASAARGRGVHSAPLGDVHRGERLGGEGAGEGAEKIVQ